jgi:O-succinylbenzoate synthase
MADQDLEARVKALEEQMSSLRTEMVEGQLEEWKARIDQLEVQAHLGQMEARGEIEPLLELMRNRLLDARQQLDRVGGAAGDAVASVSDGVKSALDDLRKALADAADRLTPRR